MKKILIQFSSPAFMNNRIFNIMDVNNLSAGWHKLKERLTNMGYQVTTADNNDLTDCAGIIFFNADSIYTPLSTREKIKRSIKKILGIAVNPPDLTRDLYTEALQANLRDKMVLVIWEPKTVCPLNFSKKTWDKFDKILTWDDDLLIQPKFSQFYIPMEGNTVLEKPVPFSEKKFIVNMSHNKYSSYKHELYSARRKTITYLSKYYPNDFDHYGLRWNRPVTRLQFMFPWLVKKYSTYRGVAPNKLETLSKYKFNLCYENTSDSNGYVCDKIFTSFHARSVPIYWGAPNIEKYVDPEAFIDRRKFKTDQEMVDFLEKIDEKEYNKYLEAGWRYMHSDMYKKILPENFCEPIIKILNL